MIAICTFKTKIGYKKFITLIGSNKLISAKNSDPGLTWNIETQQSLAKLDYDELEWAKLV